MQVVRGDEQRRSSGMVRPYHGMVLLIFLLVTVAVIVAVYAAMFRSDAMGQAQDLMYDATAYTLDCLQGIEVFHADREDAENYYITDPDTMEPYHKGKIKGPFIIALSKKTEPLYVMYKKTQIWFGCYALEAIGVFPESAPVESSFRWYRLPTKSQEKEGNSYAETVESETQK